LGGVVAAGLLVEELDVGVGDLEELAGCVEGPDLAGVVEGGAGTIVERVVKHHAEVGGKSDGVVDGFGRQRGNGVGEKVVEFGDVWIMGAGETAERWIDDGSGNGVGGWHCVPPGMKLGAEPFLVRGCGKCSWIKGKRQGEAMLEE
jgi:hypothetical protein